MAHEFYVAPAAVVCERGEITDQEVAIYHGPYGSKDVADGIARLVRSGEMKPTKAEEAADLAARSERRTHQRVNAGAATMADRNVPVQPKQRAQSDPRVVAGVIGFAGTVLLIIGIVLATANSGLGNLCSSAIGQLGQAFDTTAAAQCAHVSAEHTWGGILIVVGVAGYGLTWLMGRKLVRRAR